MRDARVRDGVVIYVDKKGQVPFRYVRLLTLGRFELAVTYPTRDQAPDISERPSDEEMLRPL